jgi:hypothetical protein
MTCSVRHVLTLAAAIAFVGVTNLRAQPAQTPQPTSRAPRAEQAQPQSQPAQTPAAPARPAQGERGPQPSRDSYRAPQGFSVVLVVADLQASTAPDDVPPAAKRALADMKEFLPYKSYKLVDAAWVLGQGTGNTSTRLRGPEDQDYEVSLAAGRGDGGGSRITVRFSLRDTGMSEGMLAERESGSTNESNREIERLEAEISRLEQKVSEAERAKQEQTERTLKSQLEATKRRKESLSTMRYQPKYGGRGGRTVIDTTFTMDVGETVVVGTSRLRANSKALIALLTAVPARGSSRAATDIR